MRKGFSQLFILIAIVLILSAGIGAYVIQKGPTEMPQRAGSNERATPTPSAEQSFSPTSTLTPTPIPTAKRCIVGGCSGELCLSENQQGSVASICIYKPEYACYKKARCEVRASGACGWTQTSELAACIKRAAPVPIPSPASCNPPVDCPAPPSGCSYQGGTSCNCGRLVCATPSPTPLSTPTPSPAATPTPSPTSTPTPPPLADLRIEADDQGFYPGAPLSFAKGTRVKITFAVRTTNVYYGGLDFRSSQFSTASAPPGQAATVAFTANSSFTITSYWPSSGVYKASLQVNVP